MNQTAGGRLGPPSGLYHLKTSLLEVSASGERFARLAGGRAPVERERNPTGSRNMIQPAQETNLPLIHHLRNAAGESVSNSAQEDKRA